MNPRSTPLSAMAAMCAIWGYSWIVMKIALRHAHPFDFAAERLVMGAVLLFAISAATGRRLTLSSYRMVAVLGFVQVGLFVILTHFALLAAGPGKTSVLTYTMPFWMIVFARLLLHERMRGAQWLSVAVAFAGLVLIVSPWRLASLEGSLLAVASGAVWALAAVMSKRWPTNEAEPLTFTAWQLAFGSIPLVVLSLLHPHEAPRWNGEYALALAYSTVFATAGGWWLWTYVLSHAPAGVTGLNTLAIPVIAVIASWLQLGERPPPHELLGMALIGVALGLLAWLGVRRAEATPVD
ncbi:MAG TPA: EamA family transporter [Usitatibacteraceae bacterium]|nr:EamA family transporter [Usitatibacteraceae bacterium]